VRLASHDYASATPLHVIICTCDQEQVLTGSLAKRVSQSIEKTSELLGYELYAYCVMPDHVHVLLSPARSEAPLREWLRKFKSFTTRQYQCTAGKARLWQRSAFDRVLRTNEPVNKVAGYIACNPERKGLVECWTEWPYSKVFVA